MNTPRFGFGASAARAGFMQSSRGRAMKLPRPRSAWRRLISQDWVWILLMGIVSAFLHQVGQCHGADDVLQTIIISFRLVHDGFDVLAIIHREHAAQAVGAQVLDEGLDELVAIRHQQLLEFFGVGERAAVQHFATGIDGRIVASSMLDELMGSPLTNGVELIERQAERIDAAMAGGAVRVLGVGLQFLPNRCPRTVGRIRFDGVDVRWRRWRGLAENGFADPDPAVDRTMPSAVGSEAEYRSGGQ